MSTVSTHVLDAALGRPATGVAVRLERAPSSGRAGDVLADATTDADGRLRLDRTPLTVGDYHLVFDTGAYFAASGRPAFYPRVIVTFRVAEAGQHHHVPLLLSPFAYSTYRGS
jgi:5-hydroxyisourate hydrolase